MNAPSAPLAASRFNVKVVRPDSGFEALYNTATGNYVVLDDELRALYARIGKGEVGSDGGGLLYRAGFAVDGGVDEVAAVGEAFSLATSSRYTPSLTIAPTMDCNFGCAYCFETHVRGVMSPAIQDRLVEFATALCRTVRKSTGLSVTWFGGEPLMGLPAIERLSERFLDMRDRGDIDWYKANIITNGYGLTPKTCAILERCAISDVQITLDGPARIHDGRRFLKRGGAPTFDRIVGNIANLAESIGVLIRMNTDRDNMDSFEELFLELDARGLLGRVMVDLAQVENFSSRPAGPALLSSREFAAFKSGAIRLCEARGWPLAADAPTPSLTGVCQVDSLNAFVVSAKGELYKCWAELENDGHCVGLLDDPASWTRIAKTALTERDPLDDGECRECALLPTCLGSCPKIRDLNRNFHGKQCPPYKYHFDELVYRQFGETSVIRKMLHAQ